MGERIETALRLVDSSLEAFHFGHWLQPGRTNNPMTVEKAGVKCYDFQVIAFQRTDHIGHIRRQSNMLLPALTRTKSLTDSWWSPTSQGGQSKK